MVTDLAVIGWIYVEKSLTSQTDVEMLTVDHGTTFDTDQLHFHHYQYLKVPSSLKRKNFDSTPNCFDYLETNHHRTLTLKKSWMQPNLIVIVLKRIFCCWNYWTFSIYGRYHHCFDHDPWKAWQTLMNLEAQKNQNLSRLEARQSHGDACDGLAYDYDDVNKIQPSFE